MLSLTNDQYGLPILVERSEEGKKCWVLTLKDKNNNRLGESALFLDANFNYTFDWETYDAKGNVEARERVTFLYTSDGKVKPSPRTLRVLGGDKVSTILKSLYRGGDPGKGLATR